MARVSKSARVFASMLLATATAVSAAPGPSLDATALMAHAANTVELRDGGGAPFRLRANFWVQEPGGGKSQGSYELAWRSAVAWREEISYPGHHQLSGEDGSGPWILADSPYRTLRLFDIANAIDVARFAKPPEGGRVETVKIQKRKVPVVQIKLALSGRFPWSELSVVQDSGVLVRHETGLSSGMRYRAVHEFSDYRPWHEHQIPGLIKRFDGTHEVLELRVESIVDLATDRSEFVARPEGAINSPVCTPQEMAATVSCDASAQTDIAVSTHGKGSVAARAVVGRDGRLHDIVLVEASDFVAAGLYRDYLELWRCVPLTCSGVAVDAEVFEFMDAH
jgi:hypothetical protein